MDRKRTILLVIFCTVALILTGELIHVFYKANFLQSTAPSFCTINSTIDCDGVAKTPYAMFFGVPLAIWGTLLYLTMLFLTALDALKDKVAESKNAVLKFFAGIFKNPRSYIATLGLLSFAISMILAGISIFKIGKICVLCFVTYFIDIFIAFIAKSEGSFFIKDIKNTFVDFFAGAKKYPWLLLAVLILAGATLTYTTKSLVFSPNQAKIRSIQEFEKMKTNPYAIQGNQLGKVGGKIQIYTYSDFMCPFCRLTNIMIHKLAKEEKEVEIHHMNFPLDNECNPIMQFSMHPGSCTLARYTLASKEQGNYWGMVNALYDNLPQNEEQVLEVAKRIGLDVEKLKKDADSDAIKETLATQIRMAQDSYISGTPSVKINGIVYMGGMPYENLKTLVKQAKARDIGFKGF